MDIGIPDIDIWAVLKGIYGFIKGNAWGLFNQLVELVGGNPIVAGIVIGFFVYICADLFYHRVIDRPTATFGERMMNSVKNLVIFIIVFIFVIFIWKGL